MKIYGWNNITSGICFHIIGCGAAGLGYSRHKLGHELMAVEFGVTGTGRFIIFAHYDKILTLFYFVYLKKEAHFGPTLVLMTDVAGSPHPWVQVSWEGATPLLSRSRSRYSLPLLPSFLSSFWAEFLPLFSYIISLFYFWAPVHAFSNYSQQKETWNSHMLPLNILLLKGQTEIAQRADTEARRASGERFLPYFSLK